MRRSTALALALTAFATVSTAQTVEVDPGAGLLTMINVLTPGEAGQDALIAQLQEALDGTLAETPGFVSGSIHRSLDSTHVVNYAQWTDEAALAAFVARLQAGEAPAMAAVFAMAMPDYHPYSVVSVHTGRR